MLTKKQESFAQAVISESSGAAAYRKVYNAAEMDDKTVWEAASRLLRNDKVAARVTELRRAVMDKAVTDQAQVLDETARIALADIAEAFDPVTGDMLPIHLMPKHIRAAISSVKITEKRERDPDDPQRLLTYAVKEIKFWDKNSAAERMMKFFGAFEKDNKQKTGLTVVLSGDDADLL